jgi:hypothetical protein
MRASDEGVVERPVMTAGPAIQLVGALLGAIVGAALWLLLSIPQDLINVICSVLVGMGAGLGAGVGASRLGGAARSAAGTVAAVVVTAVVGLATQAIITRHYLSWATDHLGGAPANPNWDGVIGALRLALDRAGARHGWTRNASYLWWSLSLVCAGTLAWYTARPPSRSASRS